MISFDMLVLLLLAAGLVCFIGEPLLGQRRLRRAESPPQTQEIERLNLQKEGLYTAIQDLDFDYQTGKVDQRDYAALRRQLEGEAIATLRELDGIDPLAALDETLEQQIASLRAASSETVPSTQVCSKCGTDYPHEARFCAVCGQVRAMSEG
jgi:ribosomal protein L40E